jgi:uncharacterized cupredoxin-like copper-binding protein
MRISTRISLLLGSLVIANTVALAHEGETHRPGGWSFGRPGIAKDVTRTIRIEADEYSFDPAAISVRVGETIKFVVVNNGKLMHELTIGDAAEQEAHQQSMSKMSDMNHDEGTQQMPANSLHIPPGQTRELTWMFSKDGKLIIACNYPGHSVLGMVGSLEVR